MSVLCSVSERIHSNLPEEAHVTLLTTTIHLINLNKSTTSHFTKVSLHDFTDLHMKLGFYRGTKDEGMGAIIALS